MRGFLRAIKVARILRDQYPRKKTNSLKWVWLSTSCLLIHSSPILFPAADVQLPVFVFPSLMTCFFLEAQNVAPNGVKLYTVGRTCYRLHLPPLISPWELVEKYFSSLSCWVQYIWDGFTPFLRLSLKHSASGVHYGNWLNNLTFICCFPFSISLPHGSTSVLHFPNKSFLF